jgi:S1-C subfamily serine protease
MRILLSLFLISLTTAAFAQPDGYGRWQEQGRGGQEQTGTQTAPKKQMVQSGTGFFVSNLGHIVTNEHVVSGCNDVTVRGSIEPVQGRVIAVDKERDLALIKADTRPRRVASIRASEENMNINDQVMVIGYPLERGITGEYKIERSVIVGLEGPQNEPYWIQFADAALQGNSGGPLLDSSGNVVGVIVGKTQLISRDTRTGEQQVIKKSDVAISLPFVKEFLLKNGVYFRYNDSTAYYSIDRVENQARDYVVNVHCKS